ncbi:MAG: sulfur oxidation c-type cytochrome SoxX, partial [Alphaproteobacteria bacterium]|nr:sulfur oxidation c-type cytochrome SoxX [Alphaproteobacteria bacterium]
SCGAAFAQQPQLPQVDPAKVNAAVTGAFSRAPAEWQQRIELDETQRLCTEKRNQVSAQEAEAIQKREVQNVVFPKDGNFLGDWKRGFQVANVGTGGQFSDKPGGRVGGNCYACHEMAPTELSFGTLGPSLKGYGKLKEYSQEAMREAWTKIYNSQAVFACSNMPRFGAKQILNEQQLKDVMAYLFSKDSPVNK